MTRRVVDGFLAVLVHLQNRLPTVHRTEARGEDDLHQVDRMLILHGLIFLGLAQGFTGFSIPSLFSRRSITARDVHLLESKGKVESFSLGAPTSKPRDGSFLSSSNIEVHYKVEDVLQPEVEVSSLIDTIDTSHG